MECRICGLQMWDLELRVQDAGSRDFLGFRFLGSG